GTDGIVGFGHEYAFPEEEIKPVALRAWVNYRPAAVQKKGAGSHVAEGAMDTGHIFIVLFDGPDNNALNAEFNGKHGFVVSTKKQARLFDTEDPRIVAYGERVLDSNFGPDGQLQMLEIPLEYRAGKGKPTYMSIVFTASKFGDYYEGGEGSLMYVDDVELVYDKK
ncbi:MAG: PCMD domain-containing protein, partial [Muribaculaceae bacterium]|nr:PCMD domain-containing protein [Muribaculaceae bacterium]